MRAERSIATATGSAFARAALAGNPSDGYGGAVLAVVLRDWRADAHAAALRDGPPIVSPSSSLVEATVARFARELEPDAVATSVRWTTSIPRAVGLGGSSAIVTAVLRALCELYEVPLEPARLAALALAVETEELGIAAGLQDRIAQAYGGLTFMDFARGRYERLDPALLPPLFVAWRTDAAEDSGKVHGELRARHERGDAVALQGMAELADIARGARAVLLSGDHAAFADCLDRSFDARRRMLVLDHRHVALIECAREAGASANYTGSGGAVVGTCRDRAHQAAVIQTLARTGCGVIAPTVK
jgi:glucuronokinase